MIGKSYQTKPILSNNEDVSFIWRFIPVSVQGTWLVQSLRSWIKSNRIWSLFTIGCLKTSLKHTKFLHYDANILLCAPATLSVVMLTVFCLCVCLSVWLFLSVCLSVHLSFFLFNRFFFIFELFEGRQKADWDTSETPPIPYHHDRSICSGANTKTVSWWKDISCSASALLRRGDMSLSLSR